MGRPGLGRISHRGGIPGAFRSGRILGVLLGRSTAGRWDMRRQQVRLLSVAGGYAGSSVGAGRQLLGGLRIRAKLCEERGGFLQVWRVESFSEEFVVPL